MKKLILSALSTAILFSSNFALAADDMEKCNIVKDGKGLIKANKADCKTMTHSCAGQNPAGEKDAFIVVQTGLCAKINQGDMTNVPQEVKDRIDMPK